MSKPPGQSVLDGYTSSNLAVKSASTVDADACSTTLIGPITVTSSASGSVWKTTTSGRERNGNHGACDGGKRGSSRWSNAPSLSRADAPPPMVGTGWCGSNVYVVCEATTVGLVVLSEPSR